MPDTLPNASGTISENIFFDDMEPGGYAANGKWGLTNAHDPWGDPTEWELGTPVVPPNPYSGNCWGTNISGNYTYRSESILKTPLIHLSESFPIISAKLTFWHIYNFSAYSPYDDIDGGWIGVEVGGHWHRIEPEGGYPGYAGFVDDGPYGFRYGIRPAYSGTISSWKQATFDLSNYIGKRIRIEFYFIASAGFGTHFGPPDYHSRYESDARGWYVDDVSVDIERWDGPIVGPDQTGVGLGGETISYTLTIKNWNNVSDTIDIYYTDTNNWQVRLFDATTGLPLQDNGGLLGFPDVYLWAGARKNIIVNVTIPSEVTEWDISDLTVVHVVSFVDPPKNDTAELITKTPLPDVGVDQISIPEIIKVNETIFINVTIKNYGDWSVSFWVEAVLSAKLIIQPSLNGSSLQFVSNLGPDRTVLLQWSFKATVACEHMFIVTTLLDVDQFKFNNKSTVNIHPHDWKLYWSDDIEDGGDAANGLWNNSIFSGSTTQWERGKISRYGHIGPPFYSMPSQEYCWGTDINSYYLEDTNCYLFTPDSKAFDFSGSDGITLSFYHYWQIQPIPIGDWGEIVYTFDPDPISTIYPTGIKYKGEEKDRKSVV